MRRCSPQPPSPVRTGYHPRGAYETTPPTNLPMPGSPATTGRSLAQTKDHVGLPIADILATISQTGANRVFVDYLQRTTP